jgi:hypothetical protein
MARMRLTLSHGEKVIVYMDPEKVAGALASSGAWGEFNRAPEGEDPDWVWVNRDHVLYFEDVTDREPAGASS